MNPPSPSALHEAIRSFTSRPRLVCLAVDVQHYAWGDPDFIPSLLNIENAGRRPFAELWMGAHPDLPAKVVFGGQQIPLNDLIDESADQVLGPAVAGEFAGRLPYLFKVLSAATPLSIQAHPTKREAERGFARENEAGIPLSANERNYKDDNHKPELIVALTDFYALRGFRPLSEAARVLREVPEFRRFVPGFEQKPDSLRALYESFMTLSQQEVDALLNPLVERLTEIDTQRPFARSDRAYWVLRADREFSQQGHRDRGLFSIYLLNLVRLQPGEALFLPAGVLHAYLEGSGMEIMANSNNVLRGGLTRKHVDVPELLRNLRFDGEAAEIVRAVPATGFGEWVYGTPACEFELRRVDLDPTDCYRSDHDHSADILILVESGDGQVTVTAADQVLEMHRGETVLAPYGVEYTVVATTPATLYKATVPMSPSSASQAALFFRGRQPTALRFGTSGLRGLVTDITDLEAYINTRGFLDYLSSSGEIQRGETVCIAGDLRPSTDSPDRSVMRAAARAIVDAGLNVENLGKIPTPALTYYAMQQGRASVMVTGSHIPFDRNGIKFNKKAGEVLKVDEAGILKSVNQVRRLEYASPAEQSLFQDDGVFKPGECRPLPAVNEHAAKDYQRRYLEFFAAEGLAGKRIVFFQHSAVGRDSLVDLLERLGAEVHPRGRSEEFIPIDTEDIGEAELQGLQRMADDVRQQHGPVDALISTDGDSDRPLLCGVEADGTVRFYGGDLLGLLVAEYLGADSVSVPISANDAVDAQLAKRGIEPTKTKIGSPNVIEAMQKAQAGGQRGCVVGWEANGGFLTGSAIEKHGRRLEPLPTRDAALPLLAALYFSAEQNCPLKDLFVRLPPRFSKAGLIDQFPQEASRAIVRSFSPQETNVKQVDFDGDSVSLVFVGGHSELASPSMTDQQIAIRRELQTFFTDQLGFDEIVRINTIDGVRIYFRNGDIAHIRPSGNAPQLRIYAVADTQRRADQIVRRGISEPGGVLRKMEAAVKR